MDSISPLSPTALSQKLGISLPYASQLLSGQRRLTSSMAIRIFRSTGHKIGPIAKATDDEIEVLERFEAGEMGGPPPAVEARP